MGLFSPEMKALMVKAFEQTKRGESNFDSPAPTQGSGFLDGALDSVVVEAVNQVRQKAGGEKGGGQAALTKEVRTLWEDDPDKLFGSLL